MNEEKSSAENQEGDSPEVELDPVLPRGKLGRFQKGGGGPGGRVSKRRSHFRGIFWDSNSAVWRVKLKFFGKHVNLGSNGDEIVAARMYDSAMRRLREKASFLNFPDESDGPEHDPKYISKDGPGLPRKGILDSERAKGESRREAREKALKKEEESDGSTD